MNDMIGTDGKLKDAFDKIHAETGLKAETMDFIAHKTKNYTSPARSVPGGAILAMACLVLLLAGLGGHRLYFTEAAIISIDINPSIELNVNPFGKVISITAYDDDGLRLSNSVNVRHMDYMGALDVILNSEGIVTYLGRDEALTISVVGQNEQQNKEMLYNIETCIRGHENAHCHAGSFSHVDEAHSAGLSVGKYQAFLELRQLDPDITVDDVKGLTMRQIHKWMDDLANGQNGDPENGGSLPPCDNDTENGGSLPPCDNDTGNGGNSGNGQGSHGHGHGHGTNH